MHDPVETHVELAVPVQLVPTLAAHRVGRGDPAVRIDPGAVWRAWRTPVGPVTVRFAEPGGGSVHDAPLATVRLTAWGPGSGWALAQAPELLGAADGEPYRPTGGHPLVAEAARRHRGLRMGASRSVAAVAVPTILEQKVTVAEARHSYRALCRVYGDRAPGPAGSHGLRLGPDPHRLAELAYHDLHRHGVERRRADTVLRVCRQAERLDRTAGVISGPGSAAPQVGPAVLARLGALVGVGPWTLAIVAQRAFGDPDAVIVGDYHLPHLVAWNLTGRPRGDDAQMLALLEPYQGQRARVVRLIGLAGGGAPRFGPRRARRDLAGI